MLGLCIVCATIARVSSSGFHFKTYGITHDLAHAAPFGTLAIFLVLGWPRRPIQVLLVVGLLGTGTEWYEHLFDNAPVERADVLVDMLGAILGVALALLMQRRGKRKELSR